MKSTNRILSLFMVIALLFSLVGDFALASESELVPYENEADETLEILEVNESEREEVFVEDPAEEPMEEQPVPVEDEEPEEAAEEEPETLPTEDASVESETETESSEEPEILPAEEDPVEAETETESTEEPELVWQELQVEAKRAELYDRWSNPTDILKSARRFWNWLFERDPEPAQYENMNEDNLPLLLKISGWMPMDITAKARVIEFDELEIYSEDALYWIELSLVDGDGELYIPEDEITVALDGATVKSALKEEQPLLVYACAENEDREEAWGEDYAADVLVYRDVFGSDERVAYKINNREDAVRFTENWDGLTVYTDRTADFKYRFDTEAEPAPLCFMLSAQLNERTVAADTEAGTSVEVSGVLSELVTAEAAAVDTSSVLPDAEGEALLAVDVTLAHESTEDFTPDQPVEVTITDAAIAEASESGAELKLWDLEAEAPVEDAVFSGSAVSFATGGVTSYAVMSVTLEKTLTASDGSAYKITVTYPTDGGIPENAELSAKEITAGEDGYEDYIERSAEALETSSGAIKVARAFDICLIDPATGEEYQPDGNVTVRIELLDETVDSDVTANVVHFGDEVETLDCESDGDAVVFVTDGFSVYVVAYTVDFHWNGYTYNLAGESDILLSELLRILGTSTEDSMKEEAVDLLALAEDMTKIESVTFSDPELIEIQQVEALDYMDDAEDDEDNAEDDETRAASMRPDWLLISLAPFDTDESLTLTLTDGRTVEIAVTDERVDGQATSNRTRITVDGVTYTLTTGGIQGGRTSSATDGRNYYGKATVYAISAGCTIHDEIEYGGNLYKVWNIATSSNNLTRIGAKMDREFVNRAAGYKFTLPKVKVDLTQDEKDALTAAGFTPGANNDTADNKVWKKAVYDPETNSIKYEIKTFQAMKEDVPLDFIFIYDDSITMYTGDRGAPINNANNNYNEAVIREAQGTRLLILSAAQALMGASTADGYNIRMSMGGASDGDRRISDWYTMGPGGYEGVEEYLSDYATGATSHATGTGNALTLARQSKEAGRNPIVIYLSDFVDGGSVASFRATANQLKSVASVYCLSTRNSRTYPRLEAIASRADSAGYRSPYIHTMSEISDGVQALETIILNAIGYYMNDPVTITDNLSDAMQGYTPGAAGLDSYSYYSEGTQHSGTAGSANQTAGKSTWTIGGTNPAPGAGQVYTETFSVQLDEETIYAGAMPTNGKTSLTRGGKETNSINPDPDDPDHLHLGNSVNFVLGRMDKSGNRLTTGTKGEPDPKINGISFTLYEAEVDADKTSGDTTVYKDGVELYTTSPTGDDGVFVLPFKDGSGNVLLELGKTYLLREGSVDDYNATCKPLSAADYMTKPQLVQPDGEWLISVGNDGVVKVSVNGAAGSTEKPTTWKGQPPKIVLWNQIIVPATLIPITVSKTWPDAIHPHEPVQFSIYAVNPTTGERLEKLIVYDKQDAATASQVQYIDSADRSAQTWTQTVYVPDKIEVDGQIIELFSESVINSSVLTDNPDNTFKIGDTVVTADNWSTYADPSDNCIHYGQSWSYDIVEESDHVYDHGWYVPSYPNNASGTAKDDGKYKNDAAVSQNSLQGYDRGQPAGYSWEPYTGSTSTDFYMAIDMHGFHFNDGTAAEKTAFKNFFGLTDSTPYQIGGANGANASNRLESPLFFNRLDTFEVTIKDRKTGKYYQVTSKVSGSYTVNDSWDHADVHFSGVKLPAIWEDYKDIRNSGQDNITSGPNNTNQTDLEIVRITAHCVNGADGTASYDLVLYSKAENITNNGKIYAVTPSSPNVMDWGPQRSSYAQWTTAIIQVSTSTTRTDRVYSSVVNTPAQQLMVYTHHAASDPAMVSSLSYVSFEQPTLTITNTWQPNDLVSVQVTKEWKVNETGTAEAYAADSYDAKRDIEFSLPAPILVPADDSDAALATMTTNWLNNGTGGASSYTLVKNDSDSASATYKDKDSWSKMVYVPTYDVSTFDHDKNQRGEMACEAYAIDDAEDITELTDLNDPASINKDEDGVPQGEWTTEKKYTAGTEAVPEVNIPGGWTAYTPDSTVTRYLKMRLTGGGQMYNLRGVRVEFNVGNDRYRMVAEQSDLPGTVWTGSAYWYLPFEVDSIITSPEVQITRYEYKTNAWKEDPSYVSIEVVSDTGGSSNIVTALTKLKYTHEKYLDEQHTPGVDAQPDTFILTNTFTPNMALTLSSVFTDGSLDKDSTKDIASVTYTIEGTTADGASYSRTATTTAAPANTDNGSTIGRTFSKMVYVPKGTYTITETAYTVGGQQCAPVAYTVKNTVDDEQDGNSRANYALNADTTITFTNVRKQLPVKVLMDWEPGLQSGEDPLAASIAAGGSHLNYTISYENSHHALQPLTGGSYELTEAREEKVYDAIPTFSVFGTYTVCELDDSAMTDVLPEYNLNVIPEEKETEINGSNTDALVFTIEAHIKRAGIVIEKHFDEGFRFDEYKGTTLTYTIERSDGQNIYGTGTNSVTMTINVPNELPDGVDVLDILTGEFVLNGYYSGLDEKTKVAYTAEDTIYLPILRATDLSGGERVKYVLTETVSDGPTAAYFPSFTDESGNPDDDFEQTNPPGQNADSQTFGEANKAKFILNPGGIVVGIDNASTPYICKIEETFNGVTTEMPFRYLNAALKYARENINMDADHPVAIQMLVDYTIPGNGSAAPGTTPAEWATNDRVVLDQATDNIIITTAATSGGVYNFVDTQPGKVDTDKGKAILTRGFDGADLFTVNNASAKLTTQNIIFDGKEGTTQHTGRAIYINNGSLTVAGGSTVRNFSTAANGGAIYTNAKPVTLTANAGETILFDNCKSNGEGGAIETATGTVTINNAGTIKANNCTGTYGGWICTDTNGELEINNSGVIEVTSCRATSNGGGAIWTGIFKAEENSGSISFTNCTAANQGGAIVANRSDASSDTFVLTNTSTGTASFTNCTASNGGAVYVKSGTCTITGVDVGHPVTFENCTASSSGGAIYQDVGSTMTLENVTFGADGDPNKACTAGTNGGAVYSAATGTVTMTNVKAYGKGSANTATYGGAIYVENAALTVNGGEFKDLAASTSGGAIYASKNLTVTGTAADNVVFENCAAGSNGGAIYQAGGDTMTLTNVTFGESGAANKGCTAALEGGCVYSQGSVATLTDCNFYYGIAGGADKKSRGGAIYYKGSASLSVYGCVFDHCSAQTTSPQQSYGNGGAIFVDDTDVALTIESSSGRRSSFTDCFAHRFGGAVMYEQNGGQSVSISGTDFTGCYTEIRGGGAVCTDSNQTTIDDCTFKGCFDKSGNGGGAIQLHPDSPGSNPSVSISNSTFEDCYTTNGNGGAIYGVSGSVPVTLENVSINGHTTGNTTSLAASTANAKSGAAVYSKGNLTIKQSGTGTCEITNCSASDANGGAVQVASGKTMTFEGNVVIYDNKSSKNGSTVQANVVLDQKNDTTINTTDTGLGANAHIGVYVTGTMTGTETDPYRSRGGFEDDFGTHGTSTANFNAFTNDRNGLYGEISSTANKIRWTGYLLKLTDANGSLLFYDDGNGNRLPAIFNSLKAGFAAAAETLYKAESSGSGTTYTSIDADAAIKVQMLKNYTQPGTDTGSMDNTSVANTAARDVTFTTAGTVVGDNTATIGGQPYVLIFNPGSATDPDTATITRDYSGGSMFAHNVNNTLTLTNITLDGGYDATAASPLTCTGNGGIVNVAAGTLSVTTGAKLQNSKVDVDSSATEGSTGLGGAVYVAPNATMNLNAGTISGNSATTAGAGIYLTAGAKLNLSGAPVFSGNTVTMTGYSTKRNGTAEYGSNNVRQDIYLPETGAENTTDAKYDPASIIVTGDITSEEGSIWVWAENQYRYKQLMPFARMADGVAFVDSQGDGPYSAAHLKAFRNARDDETTENGTDTYLYGTIEGEKTGLVYWSGSSGGRRVILRKVNSSYTPQEGKEFTVYKGSSTSAYVWKDPEGKTQPQTLENLPSQSSGVIWIGDLPNGWYILKETDGSATKYFYIVVTEMGTYDMEDDEYKNGYAVRTDAETAAKALYVSKS